MNAYVLYALNDELEKIAGQARGRRMALAIMKKMDKGEEVPEALAKASLQSTQRLRTRFIDRGPKKYFKNARETGEYLKPKTVERLHKGINRAVDAEEGLQGTRRHKAGLSVMLSKKHPKQREAALRAIKVQAQGTRTPNMVPEGKFHRLEKDIAKGHKKWRRKSARKTMKKMPAHQQVQWDQHLEKGKKK